MPNMVFDCPSYFGTGVPTNEYTTPKMRDLLKLLDNELKDVPSILIYSRYKESQACIQEVLVEKGISCEVLNGDSSQDVRESVINSFKLGDVRVLITNVQKGLNFGNCDYCIFYTYDPNPNKMVQFEGRMTRSYNIENKHVYLLISKGKELSTFKKTVSDRAKASDVFAGSDFSCVLSILLNDDRLKDLK
jgi:ERCC4-related helicase